jgi:hypothetical protein
MTGCSDFDFCKIINIEKAYDGRRISYAIPEPINP